jgi:hypothetical protein
MSFKSEIKRKFWEATCAAYNDKLKAAGKPSELLSGEIFEKAWTKARREAATLYGEPDMQLLADESNSYSIEHFYSETLNNPKGTNTINRDNYTNYRRNKRGYF